MSGFLIDTNVLSEYNRPGALTHDLTLVTRNTRDFEGVGAAVVNPWEAA